jgi:hypothetical protein
MAIAFPMPLDAPVSRAILPERSNSSVDIMVIPGLNFSVGFSGRFFYQVLLSGFTVNSTAN